VAVIPLFIPLVYFNVLVKLKQGHFFPKLNGNLKNQKAPSLGGFERETIINSNNLHFYPSTFMSGIRLIANKLPLEEGLILIYSHWWCYLILLSL